MFRNILNVAVALVAVMLVVVVSPIKAQDCGDECHTCAKGWNEGTNQDPNGEHDMTCQATEAGVCGECGNRVASHNATDAATIALAVDVVSSSAEVAAVVEAYGDRLMLNSSRGLVVVKGSKCSPDSMGRFVFVTGAKARQFRSLGVQALTEFLNTEAALDEPLASAS